MSPGKHDEKKFENEIKASLLDHGGYESIPSEEFDRERGIFPDALA